MYVYTEQKGGGSMRKCRRLLCLLFSALMLLSLVPERSAAAGTVIFTAANEKIYPLNDETMPFWAGGTIYIPQTAVVDNDLGIQYSRNREKQTVVLYQLRSGLIFNMATGYAEARDGQSFYAPTVTRGDIVFFPLDVLCRFFSLEYSYTRVTYGYLLRIKNSSAVLNDVTFIDAADQGMAQRYAQYERAHAPSSGGANTPAANDPTREQAQRTVYLVIEATDAARSARLLDSVDDAAFLFTPQSLPNADDLLRRLAAGGGAVALRIDASDGVEGTLRRIEEANRVLWNAANAKTRLVFLDGAAEETARAVADAGYCPLRFDPDYSDGYPSVSRMCTRIFSAADRSGGSCCVFLGSDEAAEDILPSLLTGLHAGNCTPARLNEVVLT